MAVKIPDCGFKFRVKNKKHSKQLQRAFFHYGFKWGAAEFTFQYTNHPFLYLDNMKFITWDSDAIYFKEQKAKEMTLNQFINFMEKIKDGYTIFGEKIKISREINGS